MNKINIATGTQANDVELAPYRPTFDELCERVSVPTIGSKDGTYFIRCAGTKRNNKDTSDTANILILDGDSRITEDGEIVSGAPDPKLIHDVLTNLGVSHCIYSSYSNDIDLHKYRVIIPCEYSPEQLPILLEYFFNELDQAGVMIADVKENKTWSQAWFFPRVPDAGHEGLFQFYRHDGVIFDANATTKVWLKNNPQPERVEPLPLRPKKPIDESNGRRNSLKEFNQSFSCEDILLRNGYIKKGIRFLHPDSESKIPAVQLCDACKDGVERVYSHGNDILNDTHSHDAFDCYRLLECSGDWKTALRWSDEINNHNSAIWRKEQDNASNQEDGKQHKDSNQDTETPKTKFKLVDVGEIMTVSAKPNWFIDGLFERNKVGQLFGKSGHGKSFVALDIAYCIATGIDYHGRETSQANVTYICGEGKSGISKRLLALESKYQAGIAGKMTVSEQPGALMKADVMKSMAEAIKEQGGVGLVIVDTYHRNMGGGKEDSSDDFGIILGNIDTYFKPLGVTTLIVHHSGHGASDRGRGSSAMYASYDFEFKAECTPDKKQLKLFNTKQKDDEELKPLLFEFEKRHLVVNDEEVTSLTLNYIGEAVTAKTGKSLNKADELVFLSLYDAIDKYGVSPSHDIKSKFGGFDGINTGKKVVHIRDWRGLVYPLLDVDVSSEKTMDAKKKSFQRARNKLFNTGMIGRFNDYCWPIDREINNRAAA